MYKIKPYTRSVNTSMFDLMDDFFNTPIKDRYVREFKVDVRDLKDKYIVEAEVPGLSKEDINVKYENEYLTISISKESNSEETTDYIHKERTFFSSERRFYLKDVNPNGLKASMNDGVLTIELNKQEESSNSYLIDID